MNFSEPFIRRPVMTTVLTVSVICSASSVICGCRSTICRRWTIPSFKCK